MSEPEDKKEEGNGKVEELDTSTTYTPLPDGSWAKETEDDVSLTDSYAVQDEIDDDEDDNSDNRN